MAIPDRPRGNAVALAAPWERFTAANLVCSAYRLLRAVGLLPVMAISDREVVAPAV
ncbi:hypothetical protein GCM10023088_09100 [Actinomadura verrucosospora]